MTETEEDPIVRARERVERLNGEPAVGRRIFELEGSIEARRVDGQFANAVALLDRRSLPAGDDVHTIGASRPANRSSGGRCGHP